MYANIEGFLTYRCMCDVFTRSNSVRNSRCYCYEDTNLGRKKCDDFTRANSVQYSQCHCYVDTNLGRKKFTMLSRGVLGIYRCTLAVTGGLELINQIHFCHTRVQLKISNVFVILQSSSWKVWPRSGPITRV